MKKVLFLFITCLLLTIAAISQNAITWNGYTLDNGSVYDDGFDFILGRTNGSTQARFITSLGLKSWLGMPATGETFQSVTDRGSTTNNTVISTNNAAFRALGTVGSPSYYQIDQTANTGGKLWRFGHTGGAPGFGSFDIYNQTDNIVALSISSNGNVGIGTTSPSYKLQVNGAAFLSGNNGVGSDYLILDHPGIQGWHHRITSDNTSSYVIGNDLGGDFANKVLTLTNVGNVGIGTVNPTQKLAVDGTILARKVKVSQSPSDWPDYVFDNSYQLAPLHDVKKYIEQNKHLPDVPSAATVKKEGIDLGDNQALLLKKIEELTLYIIAQNEKLEEQGKQIKALQEKIQ
jgi:hypothetical protein